MATIDRYILEIETTGAVRGLNSAAAASAGLGRNLGSLRGIAAAAGGALAALGAVNVASSAIEQFTAYERLNVQLQTYLGSQQAATAEMARLQTLANELPQDLQDIATAFTILTRTGTDTSNETITALSNVATANAKTFEQLGEAVADALTGEFERLKEFGIRVSKEGDQFAVDMGNGHQVIVDSAQEVVDALISMGAEGGRFAGAAAANSETLSQSFSNLQGAVFEASVAFGEGLKPGLQDAVEAITTLIRNNEELITSIGEGLGAAISGAVGFIQTLIDLFSSTGEESGILGEIFNDVLVPAFEILQTLLGTLFEAFQPVLEAALPVMATLLEGLGEVVDRIIVPAIQAFADLLVQLFEFLAPIYETALPIMVDLMGSLAETVQTVVVGAFNALVTILETVQGWISSTVEMIGNAITRIRDMAGAVSETVGGMRDSVAESAQGVYDDVTGWFGSLYDRVVGNSIIPDMVSGVLAEFDFMNTGLGRTMQSIFNTVTSAFNNIMSRVSDYTTRIRNSLSNIGGGLRSGFGTATSRISDFFAGFFENGGMIPAGQFGIVGERGPEMISGPAQVTPMDMFGSVTYNINAVDAPSFRALIARDPAFIHSVAQRGAKSVGGSRR